MTKRMTLIVVFLTVEPVVFGVAQARIELRKEASSTTLVAGGRPVATLVPFTEKDFTAEDAVREVRPASSNGRGPFTTTARITSGRRGWTMELEALYACRHSSHPGRACFTTATPGAGLEPEGFVKDGCPGTLAITALFVFDPRRDLLGTETRSVGLFFQRARAACRRLFPVRSSRARTRPSIVWSGPEEETPPGPCHARHLQRGLPRRPAGVPRAERSRSRPGSWSARSRRPATAGMR